MRLRHLTFVLPYIDNICELTNTDMLQKFIAKTRQNKKHEKSMLPQQHICNRLHGFSWLFFEAS